MVRPPLHRRRAALLIALLATVVIVAVAGLSVALTLAPAIVLLTVLAHGIHPGEALIDRWRRARARVRRAAVRLTRPDLPLLVARTGRRLHAALAMRPPPAVA